VCHGPCGIESEGTTHETFEGSNLPSSSYLNQLRVNSPPSAAGGVLPETMSSAAAALRVSVGLDAASMSAWPSAAPRLAEPGPAPPAGTIAQRHSESIPPVPEDARLEVSCTFPLPCLRNLAKVLCLNRYQTGPRYRREKHIHEKFFLLYFYFFWR
jgi:hypothetical protein